MKLIFEFIRFLYIAKGSAGELKTQLYIAKEIGYLSLDEFRKFNQKVEKIGECLEI
ncbi:MAG: four helix bundle protein [Candidatus Desulfofervidaceae bacterium]|nr:four helix bundle protein [Candidatus Desulfofervidaceae bacterium]